MCHKPCLMYFVKSVLNCQQRGEGDVRLDDKKYVYVYMFRMNMGCDYNIQHNGKVIHVDMPVSLAVFSSWFWVCNLSFF